MAKQDPLPLLELGVLAVKINRILNDGEWHTTTNLQTALGSTKGSSRRQIQRYIQKMRSLGFAIESHKRRGYRLISGTPQE